jgi:peptidoglycan/LPS O-acetylase OafA/YrhL
MRPAVPASPFSLKQITLHSTSSDITQSGAEKSSRTQKQSPASELGKRLPVLQGFVFLAVLSVSYVLIDYMVLSSFSRIVVEMEGSVASRATVYYSTTYRHEGFSERQAVLSKPYTAGSRTILTFDLNNNTVKKLRLDPGDSPGIYKIYSISLLNFFGHPVNLIPFAPELEIRGGPNSVVRKEPYYLEISSQGDDPHCIFELPLAVHNPYFRFAVPLVFATLAYLISGRVKSREFLFWKDVQGRTSSSGMNYQALHGLRGLAALLVIIEHSGVPGCGGVGMVGVVIFFCLSGFLLTLPFAGDGAKILKRPFVEKYFIRRVCRIVPMFYAVVLVVYVFNYRIEDAFRSALFLQGNGIYWTVLQEMHFYLLLPFIMLINHLLLKDKKWLIILFLGVLGFSFNNGLLATYQVYSMGNFLPLYAGLFVGGMMTCYIFHIQNIRESGLLMKLCGNHFLTLGLFLVILFGARLNTYVHGYERVLGSRLLTGNFNYLVAALIFVLVMSKSSLIAQILCALPLRVLGTVSYSFYLLHPIFIKGVKERSLYYLHTNIDNTTACAIALILTLLVSLATYTLIERPFIIKDISRNTADETGC